MWLLLNDSFLSIVRKDCPAGSLLVRARRPGDIEKVFGRHVKVTVVKVADYLYRAVIPTEDVAKAMQNELLRVDYPNFKDSVTDNELHDAYLRCWSALARVQPLRPYSGLGSYLAGAGFAANEPAPKHPARKPRKKKGGNAMV